MDCACRAAAMHAGQTVSALHMICTVKTRSLLMTLVTGPPRILRRGPYMSQAFHGKLNCDQPRQNKIPNHNDHSLLTLLRCLIKLIYLRLRN
jgi:hypothetical protein